MSGGSYDYKYYILEDYYVGRMFDKELDELCKDLAKVFHDVEWWQSSDIGEEEYRKTVQKFKKKWLKQYNKNFCYDFCPHKALTEAVKEKLREIESLE